MPTRRTTMNDAERLRPLVRSCVNKIRPTTGTEEIVDWTEALLREGHPVRFGRLVFEVTDSRGRYYAGDGEKSRGTDDLWDELRCRETVSILSRDEHGVPFKDIRTFAARAARTWSSDWGTTPPQQLLEKR
jgi:hypothetical protein